MSTQHHDTNFPLISLSIGLLSSLGHSLYKWYRTGKGIVLDNFPTIGEIVHDLELAAIVGSFTFVLGLLFAIIKKKYLSNITESK